MKKNYTLIILLLVSFLSFSQQMPLDFNSNTHVFNVFDEVTNASPPNKFDIFTNPQDGSDKTGRFFLDGNNPSDSQGFYAYVTSNNTL